MFSKSRFCALVIFFLNLIDTDLVEGKGGGRGGGRGGSRGGSRGGENKSNCGVFKVTNNIKILDCPEKVIY